MPAYSAALLKTERTRIATPVAIDSGKTYALGELIDIAQRNNPETRVAWEHARQAAIGIGLAEGTYYPALVAAATGAVAHRRARQGRGRALSPHGGAEPRGRGRCTQAARARDPARGSRRPRARSTISRPPSPRSTMPAWRSSRRWVSARKRPSRSPTSLENSAYQGVDELQYDAGFRLEWDLFQGFERRNNLHLAESMQREAEDELEHAKDQAVREVWKAYDDTKVALAKHRAAEALLAASEKAWAATLESYQHGLSTFPDVRESARTLERVRTAHQEARAEVLTRAAAFAFSTGDLARPTVTRPSWSDRNAGMTFEANSAPKQLSAVSRTSERRFR